MLSENFLMGVIWFCVYGIVFVIVMPTILRAILVIYEWLKFLFKNGK